MKPLRVLLATKGNSRGRFLRDARMVGYWSYGVPEFTWDHLPVWKTGEPISMKGGQKKYDLVFVEDGTWPIWKDRCLPVVYHVVDSTLSRGCHFEPRLELAKQCDLVLIEHDRLERFAEAGRPVRRWAYCVNDDLFKDYGLEKAVDVCSHFNSGGGHDGGRKELGRDLGKWCKEKGYVYRGGCVGGREYAKSFNAAKISANWPRWPENRPHRVLDVMACRSCLLTGPIPDVSGEEREEGRDYVEVPTVADFYPRADELLRSGRWKEIADNGYELVQERHTWAVRAGELRQILSEELGL
jgi:glycosyltransferase involved in cell wall biosynthesis